MANEAETPEKVVAGVGTDPRLLTPAERCEVLRILASWARGFTKEQYASHGECAAYPLDSVARARSLQVFVQPEASSRRNPTGLFLPCALGHDRPREPRRHGGERELHHPFLGRRVELAGIGDDGTYLYWADKDEGTIGRANLDGTGVNQGFITGVENPISLSVSIVPEPATGLLVMIGVLGLAVSRRRAGVSAWHSSRRAPWASPGARSRARGELGPRPETRRHARQRGHWASGYGLQVQRRLFPLWTEQAFRFSAAGRRIVARMPVAFLCRTGKLSSEQPSRRLRRDRNSDRQKTMREPWMRGAPQVGFSRAIRTMSLRTSASSLGRPGARERMVQ